MSYISLSLFLLKVSCSYKSLAACTLNNTSPLPFGLSPIAQTCVNSLQNYTSFARGEVGTHIDRYRSLIMPLVHGRKKSTLARSLVLFVKFGAHRLAAVAARVPSANRHIPFISTLKTSERSPNQVQFIQKTKRRQMRKIYISLLRLRCIFRVFFLCLQTPIRA